MQVCLAILSNFKSDIYPITKLYVNQMLVNMFILNERHKMNMIGNSLCREWWGPDHSNR